MKTSKITEVTGNGHFDGQYGRMYKWEVAMENGDRGEVSTKEQNQNKWVVGKEVSYETKPSTNPKFLPKFTLVQGQGMQPNTSFTKSESRDESIYKCNSLNNAVALHAGGNASVERVIETAKVFYNYLTGTDNKTESKTDDLPF